MSSGKWRPSCLGLNVLTHWGLNKMANILEKTFWTAFFKNKISLKYILTGLTDNKSTLIHRLIWHQSQVINWNNVDKNAWQFMVSLSHNELTQWYCNYHRSLEFNNTRKLFMLILVIFKTLLFSPEKWWPQETHRTCIGGQQRVGPWSDLSFDT